MITRKFSVLALALALLPSLAQATQYDFYNVNDIATITLTDAAGQPLTSAWSLQLGAFAPGFIPDSSNTAEWQTEWKTVGDPGFISPDGEWSAILLLPDDSLFEAGTQLYLWAFNHQAAVPDAEWLLLTSADWQTTTNSDTDIITRSFYFPFTYIGDTEFTYTNPIIAVFGSYEALAGTAQLSSAAVPEPGATALLLAAGLAAVAIRRRFSTQP